MDEVLVTFAADRDRGEAIQEVLAGIANVGFLDGMTEGERRHALRRARVILSGAFASEIRPEEMPELRSLRMLQILSAGANRLPFPDIPKDVTIASNVGAYAEPMAEHVVAMVLALAKDLVGQDARLRQGVWDRSTQSRRLAGMKAGILGYGGIGKSVARLLRGFGVGILAINRTGLTEDSVDFVGTLDDLDRVLPASDIVVVCLPLTRVTKHLIGVAEFRRMKPDAMLINVARGALLDEEALYLHCQETPSFLVGLDVWTEEPFVDGRFAPKYPLLELPNVIGSPHNSGSVPGIWLSAVRQAAENVRRFLEGAPVRGIVRREEYA